MARLRVTGYVVAPQVYLDDGDTLTPVPVQPVTVPPASWPSVVDDMAEGLTKLEAQLCPDPADDSPDPEAPPQAQP